MRRRFGLWSPGLALFPARGRNMPPLSLSDEEMSLLRELSAPIDRRRRPEFLIAVALELEASGQAGEGDAGPGLVHRVAREVQRRYSLAPQPGTNKHARA
jgi:hypothetical protein